MTDQTRWGIPQVHQKNKAIKKQKDLVGKQVVTLVIPLIQHMTELQYLR